LDSLWLAWRLELSWDNSYPDFKDVVQKIVMSQIAKIFGKFCFLVYSMQKGRKFASNIPVSFNSKTIC